MSQANFFSGKSDNFQIKKKRPKKGRINGHSAERCLLTKVITDVRQQLPLEYTRNNIPNIFL